MLQLSLIACVDKKLGIGKGNDLIYTYKEDMEHFIKTTRGHIVIMGSETYLSLKRPLKDRLNIVLTSGNNKEVNERRKIDGKYLTDKTDILFVNSVEEVLRFIAKPRQKDRKAFVIGGESIYTQFLLFASELILTEVDDVRPADKYFPEFNWLKFEVVEERSLIENVTIKIYERKVDRHVETTIEELSASGVT
ncbi:dihydrofolate reductase [Exiguobacterium sp. SH5S4]|uniref:dihydrofolate reductase n=1 Tax=Exiguobacterium sp. SH5S4 TaxID=2510961 RepID=UPI0013754809|nr:dihydrofolate reductase [Exiguobacterium sp. SH5S4]